MEPFKQGYTSQLQFLNSRGFDSDDTEGGVSGDDYEEFLEYKVHH